jgi:tripartite-type tricarboxylate transporter receptor subunit TctC
MLTVRTALVHLHQGGTTMTLQRRRFLRLAAAGAMLPLFPELGAAQAYPDRPVKLIVPYAPGGPTDVAARLIAQELSERLGKQFFVENVGGAGGNIGTGQAAKAAPDGYTVLIAVNSHVINPTLYDTVPYDPYKDFDPVTLAVTFSTAFMINPSVPANSVAEFVAYAKANTGKLSFASSGVGTPSHLLGEQFHITQNLDLVHVPFNGSGPAIASVVAGHTPIGFAALSSAAPFVNDGKLRVLATMSQKRSEALPQVPTIAEAGFPGLDGDGWIGALMPAGTSKDIVSLLHREINGIIAKPAIKARLAVLGLDPVGTTPEEFATLMKAEAEKWAKVIRAAGLKAK